MGSCCLLIVVWCLFFGVFLGCWLSVVCILSFVIARCASFVVCGLMLLVDG